MHLKTQSTYASKLINDRDTTVRTFKTSASAPSPPSATQLNSAHLKMYASKLINHRDTTARTFKTSASAPESPSATQLNSARASKNSLNIS